MAGSEEEEDHSLWQSPRTRGVIQHFERQVQRHIEGLDNDMQVTMTRLIKSLHAMILLRMHMLGLLLVSSLILLWFGG
jgi:hypothetical protein